MYARLAILLVVLMFSLPIYRQEKHASGAPNQNPSTSTQQVPPPNISVSVINEPKSNASESDATKQPKCYFDLLLMPSTLAQIALVIVGIWTLGILRKQTKATEVSAESSMKQANHLVASERAWMIARPDFPIPPRRPEPINVHVTWQFINKGKSPAYILEIGTNGCILPYGKSLPDTPPLADSLEQWNIRRFPILPNEIWTRLQTRIMGDSSIRLYTGNNGDVLWVYGYIKYEDSFGNYRKTGFCYRWEPVSSTGQPAFVLDGSSAYNYAT